jgi:hypothetical protein
MIPAIDTAKDLCTSTPFFPSGFQGQIQIDSVKELNGFKGHAFIVEFTVVSSNLPDVKVGEIRSWYVSMATPKLMEFALPNLKQFTLAACGAKNDAAKLAMAPMLNAAINEACLGHQPMKGKKVFLMTRSNDAGTFTKHSFSAV